MPKTPSGIHVFPSSFLINTLLFLFHLCYILVHPISLYLLVVAIGTTEHLNEGSVYRVDIHVRAIGEPGAGMA
jgi:uncharacterized Tic20 family protein